MSNEIAEAPPIPTKSAAQPLQSAKEAGLVSIADAFKQHSKTPVAPPEPKPDVDTPEPEPKPAAVNPGLLESVSEIKPEPEKPAKTNAADWKRLKEEREAFRTEAETLKAQLAEINGIKTERDTLKSKAERVDELERRLEETAFERSDRYQKLVQERQDYETSAKELAKEFEVGEDVIDRAIAAKGKKRIDILEEAFASSPAAAARFERVLAEVDRVDSIKASEMKTYRERMEKLSVDERRRAADAENEEKQTILNEFDRILPRIADKIPDFRKTGDPEKDALIEANIAQARKLVSGDAPLEDIVAAPYLAVKAKSLMVRNATLERDNAALLKRLEAYTKNTPSINSDPSRQDTSASEKKGMMDAYKQRT